MGYYGTRRYRSWRSRGWAHEPSKFSRLVRLFGEAVPKIQRAFETLETEAFEELMQDYGDRHGKSAEQYARKTYPLWKSGATKLSGQTMERLVELVPPYLSAEQRFSVLQSVVAKHKRANHNSRHIKINIQDPYSGFSELGAVLAQMDHGDQLADIPSHVMEAAGWLCDDDMTVARAMLADAVRRENEIIRQNAARDIELLKRTISSGQVTSASYSVEMPAGQINVVAFTPSKCFVATVCFGADSAETSALRKWRDSYLLEKAWGRGFIVWYYQNGEEISKMLKVRPWLCGVVKGFLKVIVLCVK